MIELNKEHSGKFSSALVRKLVQFHEENQAGSSNGGKKMSRESAQLAGELLRLFVLEARHRACILAECEQEVDHLEGSSAEHSSTSSSIRSYHIAQISAELLMDFS